MYRTLFLTCVSFFIQITIKQPMVYKLFNFSWRSASGYNLGHLKSSIQYRATSDLKFDEIHGTHHWSILGVVSWFYWFFCHSPRETMQVHSKNADLVTPEKLRKKKTRKDLLLKGQDNIIQDGGTKAYACPPLPKWVYVQSNWCRPYQVALLIFRWCSLVLHCTGYMGRPNHWCCRKKFHTVRSCGNEKPV